MGIFFLSTSIYLFFVMQKWSFVYYFYKKRSDGFIRHLHIK